RGKALCRRRRLLALELVHLPDKPAGVHSSAVLPNAHPLHQGVFVMTATATADELLVESAAVVRLTLNRPTKRNALSRSLLLRLRDELDRVAADANARAVVLAAAGPVFCSGHDL